MVVRTLGGVAALELVERALEGRGVGHREACLDGDGGCQAAVLQAGDGGVTMRMGQGMDRKAEVALKLVARLSATSIRCGCVSCRQPPAGCSG